jgi:two-component system cell cycle response regulator
VSEQDVLLAALEARDPGTARHTRGVIELSERVAIRLGLSDEGAAEVAQVAALHDIGKLHTPDAILHKTGLLDETERAIMQAHTIIGGDMVSRIPILAHLAGAVRATHERWDGAGYPDGLTGTMIPLASRIVFVCEAHDAITSPRPYRASILGDGAAIHEIRRCAGTQFCPGSAEGLVAVLAFERATALAS